MPTTNAMSLNYGSSRAPIRKPAASNFMQPGQRARAPRKPAGRPPAISPAQFLNDPRRNAANTPEVLATSAALYGGALPGQYRQDVQPHQQNVAGTVPQPSALAPPSLFTGLPNATPQSFAESAVANSQGFYDSPDQQAATRARLQGKWDAMMAQLRAEQPLQQQPQAVDLLQRPTTTQSDLGRVPIPQGVTGSQVRGLASFGNAISSSPGGTSVLPGPNLGPLGIPVAPQDTRSNAEVFGVSPELQARADAARQAMRERESLTKETLRRKMEGIQERRAAREAQADIDAGRAPLSGSTEAEPLAAGEAPLELADAWRAYKTRTGGSTEAEPLAAGEAVPEMMSMRHMNAAREADARRARIAARRMGAMGGGGGGVPNPLQYLMRRNPSQAAALMQRMSELQSANNYRQGMLANRDAALKQAGIDSRERNLLAAFGLGLRREEHEKNWSPEMMEMIRRGATVSEASALARAGLGGAARARLGALGIVGAETGSGSLTPELTKEIRDRIASVAKAPGIFSPRFNFGAADLKNISGVVAQIDTMKRQGIITDENEAAVMKEIRRSIPAKVWAEYDRAKQSRFDHDRVAAGEFGKIFQPDAHKTKK